MAGIFGLLLSGAQVIKDQFFNLTSLLLPGNGSSGQNNRSFIDSGTANGGTGFSITPNGNVTQGSFSPFSQTGWGNYFDGTDSLYGTTAVVPATTAFTLEMWLYIAGSGENQFFAQYSSGTSGRFIFTFSSTGYTDRFALSTSGGVAISSTGTYARNAWHHVAIGRDGSNNWAIWVNGTRDGTNSFSISLEQRLPVIGHYVNTGTSGGLNGYISNLRVITSDYYGVGNSTITVPTSPLTAVSGTVLLTCQSNRFVDNKASSPQTLTPQGDTRVVAFSPFAPTAAYTTSVVGGSGYFDGNNDYLVCGAAADWAFMSNTTALWSVEMWVYPTVGGTNTTYLDTSNSTTANVGIVVQKTTSDVINVQIFYGSAGNTIVNGSSTTTLKINAWNYVLITYDQSQASQNLKFYINEGSAETANKTGNTPSSSNPNRALTIGTYGAGGGQFFTGYFGSMRVSNVIRTSGVPTTPYASDANTKLLLNFTNGAIFDATAKNDLETVGNAQISTGAGGGKWGGGSIYFDGTSTVGLTIPNSSLLTFGSGDWSIEFWIYRVGNSTTQGVFDQRTAAATEVRPLIYINTSNQIVYYTNAVDRITASLSQNTWVYVAVVKSSGVTRMYIDGTVQATTYTDTNTYLAPTNQTRIGRLIDGFPLNGYIDDFRITLGQARTTTASPTAPFPLQ